MSRVNKVENKAKFSFGSKNNAPIIRDKEMRTEKA
jgi:hypothetical protein